MINENNCRNRTNSYKLFFLIAFIIVSIFTTSKELVYKYYLRSSSNLLILGVLVIFMLLVISNKKIYLDSISTLLLLRLLIYITPLSFTSVLEGYWGNYLTVIASFVAYLISSQNHYRDRDNLISKINRIFMIFLILTSIQVVYMFFLLSSKYGTLNINLFKYHLVIPIGSSNYIASVILPLMIFIIYSEVNKKLKYLSLILALIALLIIQSKNAIFVLIIFIAYKFIKRYFTVMIHIKDNRAFMIALTVFLITSGLYIIYLLFSYFLKKWNMGMSFSGVSLYETINALSSNRLNIYIKELTRWTDSFLFGNGLGYEVGYSRSHNWLIDLLVQSGILGFIVYLCALVLWYLKVFRNKYFNKFMKSIYYSIIIILIQGLAEVSIFTVTIDILLWYLIGLSVSESNAINYYKKSENI